MLSFANNPNISHRTKYSYTPLNGINLGLVSNRLVFERSIMKDITLDISDSRRRVVALNADPM